MSVISVVLKSQNITMKDIREIEVNVLIVDRFSFRIGEEYV